MKTSRLKEHHTRKQTNVRAMIEWGKEALSDLRKLPRNLRERIFYSVERFDTSGIGDVKKLKGFEA